MLWVSWRAYFRGAPLPEGALLLTGSIVILIAGWFAYLPWQHYWSFRARPGFAGPYTFDFGPEQFTVATSIGSGTLRWEAVTVARESRSLFILGDRSRLLAIVPKRFLSPEEQTKFQALLVADGLLK